MFVRYTGTSSKHGLQLRRKYKEKLQKSMCNPARCKHKHLALRFEGLSARERDLVPRAPLLLTSLKLMLASSPLAAASSRCSCESVKAYAAIPKVIMGSGSLPFTVFLVRRKEKPYEFMYSCYLRPSRWNVVKFDETTEKYHHP